MALRTLPLSLAYATWSGVGTAASVVLGALLFSEKISAVKLLWIAMIVAGVVGLNM
jgi:quaternary ammonium compound-resistance protein SugE